MAGKTRPRKGRGSPAKARVDSSYRSDKSLTPSSSEDEHGALASDREVHGGSSDDANVSWQVDVENDVSPKKVPSSGYNLRRKASPSPSRKGLYPGLPSSSPGTDPSSSPELEEYVQRGLRDRQRGIDSPDFAGGSRFNSGSDVFSSPEFARGRQIKIRASPSSKSPIKFSSVNEASQNKVTDQGDISGFCYICIIVCLLCVTIYFVLPCFIGGNIEIVGPEEQLSAREKLLETFALEMQSLSQTFPAQTTRFWKVLKAATKRVLRETDPLQPAAIILAGTVSNNPTMECISRKFAAVVTRTYQAQKETVEYNPFKDSSGMSSDQMKLDLDSTLSRGFNSGSRAAIVHKLHQIPGRAAMMLHAYCDNDSAPFKDAVFVFNVEVAQGSRISALSGDAEVEERLTKQWERDLDIDKLTALLSRLANSVAVIQAETQSTLANAGC